MASIHITPAPTTPALPRATLPARLADTGRVRFGAGVGILPRRRG